MFFTAEDFLVADFCGFAGTWMASQWPHQLHLLSHFGGFDPICPLNISLSSFTVLVLIEIDLPSALIFIWVDANIRRQRKETVAHKILLRPMTTPLLLRSHPIFLLFSQRKRQGIVPGDGELRYSERKERRKWVEKWILNQNRRENRFWFWSQRRWYVYII